MNVIWETMTRLKYVTVYTPHIDQIPVPKSSGFFTFVIQTNEAKISRTST